MTTDPRDSQPNSIHEAAQAVADQLHQIIEQSTETIGSIVAPIAENPLIKFATKVPGISWLMAALGQVNVEKVQREVAELRQTYPLETAEQLAQRVIVETAWRAAGIGLVTNFVPPLALFLFAVDLGAIAALQAEMIYRIAAIYGFSPQEPTRRGEVLAIWGLSTGGSGLLKTGLSFVELLPGIGAAVGITSDAALLYGLGYLAARFYETKRQSDTSAAEK
ncbi:EcsC family protein [Phormidium tenue FACHB-886]|nr:EcsC family protein [Phormidium tenue FACHB-886]